MKPAHDDDGITAGLCGDGTILLPLAVQLTNEIDHRVANNLQLVSAMLLLQAREINDEHVRHILLRTQQRIAAIGWVHRHLYQAGDEQLVDIYDYLHSLAKELQDMFGLDPTHRRVEADIERARVPAEVATSLGILTTELVTNACKHAYSLNEPGVVRIHLYQDVAGMSRLEVRDYGIGRSGMLSSAREGLGSLIIDAMARKLNAKYVFLASDPGTQFVLTGRFISVGSGKA
jgi:two-component sensor histidine kinase